MKRIRSFTKVSAVAMLLAALVVPTIVVRAEVRGPKPLTDDQKVLHVLNRLGFGARPGDVEKVKAIGLKKYIDQQLDPGSIADPVAESKVKQLDAFGMSTAELFAKYPNPGALLQQIEGRAAQNRNQNRNQNQSAPTPQDPSQMTEAQQRERREMLQELYRKYDLRPAQQLVPQIVANRVLRAVYSERQLQEVMVDFWQNHFNVYSGKAAVRWYIPSYERDVLRKHALGNFRDLVVGTAQHPAMLFYLDNFESVSPNSGQQPRNQAVAKMQEIIRSGGRVPTQLRERIKQQQNLTDDQLDQRIRQFQTSLQQANRRGINENYARELMELHTLGVDGGYTQKDIIEVAKCFTGWTIADARGYRRAAAATIQGTEEQRLARLQRQAGIPDDVESGQFYFNSRWHEGGAKTVLGQKIEEGGVRDGLKVIDLLVAHPSTAQHLARKLAVRFVSDKPSDGLVNRIAEAFRKSKGDIRTTLRALFSDKEFFAPENYRAKIKSPFELAVSSIRVLCGDTDARPALVAMLNKLGEVPYGYQAPTGYPDTAEDWVNAGALLERLNFAIAIASNRIPGTRVDLKTFESKDTPAILDRAISVILGGEISSATKATLLKQLDQPLPDVKAGSEPAEMVDVPNMRPAGQPGGVNRQAVLLNPSGNADIFKVVSLVLGTPEFQRQ